MTWRQEAAAIIANATCDLPPDTTLADRKRAVDAARPHGWAYASWPQKAWQAARRDYLVPFGYQPKTKTKKAKQQAAAGMPLFEDHPHD